MSRPSEAYPWTLTGYGLCKALRDPQLWASSFPNSEHAAFRVDVVALWPKQPRLAPRSLLAKVARSLPPDDRTFGAIMVEILAVPRKRERLIDLLKDSLRKKWSWTRFLAQKLFEHLRQSHDTLFPELDVICVERDDAFFLDTLKFRAWLRTINTLPEMQQPLASFGCAFAILQPREAPELLQCLVDRDPGFHAWLADSETNSTETQDVALRSARAIVLDAPVAENEDQNPPSTSHE